MTTYRDLIDHLTLVLGSGVNETTQESARRAVQQAYDSVGRFRKWSYYYELGRFISVAPQETGTITYDATGGAFEKMLTLSGATWPTWAASACVLIEGTIYQVNSQKSATVVTLSDGGAADIAAGTTYKLYQDTFTLPANFMATDKPLHRQGFELTECHPTTWLRFQNLSRQFGQPIRYTITSDPRNRTRMAIRLDPAPADAYLFDYWYRRCGRPMRIEAYSEGLATVSGTTLTASGATFNAAMVDSVVRFSVDANAAPTDLSGTNPYVGEAAILSFDSSTQLTLEAAPGDVAGVKYLISDPVDIEPGAMLTYLLRECEYQMRLIKSMNSTAEQKEALESARQEAACADDRSFEQRRVGQVPKALDWTYWPVVSAKGNFP